MATINGNESVFNGGVLSDRLLSFNGSVGIEFAVNPLMLGTPAPGFVSDGIFGVQGDAAKPLAAFLSMDMGGDDIGGFVVLLPSVPGGPVAGLMHDGGRVALDLGRIGGGGAKITMASNAAGDVVGLDTSGATTDFVIRDAATGLVDLFHLDESTGYLTLGADIELVVNGGISGTLPFLPLAGGSMTGIISGGTTTLDILTLASTTETTAEHSVLVLQSGFAWLQAFNAAGALGGQIQVAPDQVNIQLRPVGENLATAFNLYANGDLLLRDGVRTAMGTIKTQSIGDGETREYYLPDWSGTIPAYSGTAPTDGQALIWDNASNYWKAGSPTAAAAPLVDVLAAGNLATGYNIDLDGQSITNALNYQLLDSTFVGTLGVTTLTGTAAWTLPDASGTIALTSDLPATPVLIDVLAAGNIATGYNIDLDGQSVLNALNYQFIDSTFVGTLAPTTLTGTAAWTLPDATGTIALTSDIPAAQSLIDVLATGNLATGYNIDLNGQSVLNALDYQFANSTFVGTLAPATLTGPVGWTLPDAGGTIALTSDIPGTPTLIDVLTAGNLATGYDIDLNGQSTLNATNYQFVDATYQAILQVAGALTGDSTWNLPDGGGNLITDSQLAGYLPLSGGTMSGNLAVDSENAVAIDFNWVTAGLKGTLTSAIITTADKVWTLPDADGTIALTSDLGSYLPLGGGIMTGNITMTSTGWVGLGASAGRIVFTDSTPDTIDIVSASLTVPAANNIIFKGATYNGILASAAISGTDKTWTFPNTTGTVALTSDLSAYLGLNGGTMSGAINMNGSVIQNAGYVTLLSNTRTGQLTTTLTTTNRIWTFPDKTGTVAMTSDIPAGGPFLPTAGGTMLGDIAMGNNRIKYSNGFDGYLQTASLGTADRNWTLPDATGTIALTSTVLALAGGTMSGDINLNSNDITNASTYQFLNSTFIGTLQTTTLTATRAWTLPNNTGTLALLSDTSLNAVLTQGNQSNGIAMTIYDSVPEHIVFEANPSSRQVQTGDNGEASTLLAYTDSSHFFIIKKAGTSGQTNFVSDNLTNLRSLTLPDWSGTIPAYSGAAPTDGQALIWDNGNGYWKAGSPTAATPTLSAVLAAGNSAGSTDINLNSKSILNALNYQFLNSTFVGTLGVATLTGTQAWTLPNATGTIALSSTALMLAGGTMSGDINLNGNDITNGATYQFLNSGFIGTLQTTTLSAARQWTFPNTTGTVALTSTVLALAGGTMSGDINMNNAADITNARAVKFLNGAQITNIDSGALSAGTTVLNTQYTYNGDACVWDYVIKGVAGSIGNLRAGTITAVWNGVTTVTHVEVSTQDIGDTTPVVLDVAPNSTSEIQLKAIMASGNWQIRVVARLI